MQINYLKLGLTLYFVLTLSQLTIDGIEGYVAVKAAEAAFAEFEKENKKRAAAIKLEIERDLFLSDLKGKKKNKHYNNKSQQRDNARRINDQVCSFWRNEYNKTRNKYNERMM
jgi:hypothetical protein